ncbi:MAG: TrmB family transcriptional regulator [Clostridia bacterium]|nr:TrmB family transcriptional regulator [Clostridia bacterium]
MDTIDCLMKVGLTKHESILYVTLCTEGELTGYEAAKISGIPRSNTYLALAGLVDKGGAYRIESDVVKYIAVKPEEFARNIQREFEQALSHIIKDIQMEKAERESFINISGKKHILNKMKNIIDLAEERVYLSISLKDLENVKNEIGEAKKRGLKIVIITDQRIEMDGLVVYYNQKQPGQIRLIADTAYVLTGEISENESNSTCLYSKNKNLVQLIKDSLTNEIKLIEMKNKDEGRSDDDA